MESIQDAIKHLLSSKTPGVVFPIDFRGFGTEGAIKMALSRLVRTGELRRLAHGIYYIPAVDPVLGELTPSAEGVAEHLAERQRVRIRPAGAFALNKLGLSTQVPTKLVYITDGHPRKLKIGKVTIEFKATTPKKMALKGKISSLLILALEELDLEHIDEATEKRICNLLMRESQGDLQHDLQLTSGRIYDYLIKIKKKMKDEGMAVLN